MFSLQKYRNKRIAIYGMGKSGCSVAKRLKFLKAKISCWDDDSKVRKKIRNLNFPVDKFWLNKNVIDYIVVSPGIVDGYLWEGTITGSGLPPGLVTAIFACGGTFETVIANIFIACDFSNPLFAFIDDEGNFSMTVDDPQPTHPDGSCLLFTTDPDDNPDTDDGPGAIVCSNSIDFSSGQTFPEETAPDLLSNPDWADPGIEVVFSPGIVDGYLWSGTISGSGFTPGEVVGAIGCAATYETFRDVFLFLCDYENPALLGLVDENGTFVSEPGPPAPTVAQGTCVLVGTDPDNNPDTDDGEGAVICTQ